MPHLTLQYTSNIKQEIDYSELFSKFHEVLNKTGGIKIENCKSRVVKLDNFYISKGEENSAFVHLEVKFLQGRTDDLKREIGNQLIEILKGYYADSGNELDIQITIEILDINRDIYFKHPPGAL